jgi:hypothetical protein
VLHLENDAAFAPVSIPWKTRIAPPLLVSITCWLKLVVLMAWFPNETLVAERVTAGGTVVPVPVSAIACGEALSLSVMVKAAEYETLAAGVKNRWPRTRRSQRTRKSAPRKRSRR